MALNIAARILETAVNFIGVVAFVLKMTLMLITYAALCAGIPWALPGILLWYVYRCCNGDNDSKREDVNANFIGWLMPIVSMGSVIDIVLASWLVWSKYSNALGNTHATALVGIVFWMLGIGTMAFLSSVCTLIYGNDSVQDHKMSKALLRIYNIDVKKGENEIQAWAYPLVALLAGVAAAVTHDWFNQHRSKIVCTQVNGTWVFSSEGCSVVEVTFSFSALIPAIVGNGIAAYHIVAQVVNFLVLHTDGVDAELIPHPLAHHEDHAGLVDEE